MYDWTAVVTVGQAKAEIDGSGAMSVGDVICKAAGVAQVDLMSVSLMVPQATDQVICVTRLMVGFTVGGVLMHADIVFARDVEDAEETEPEAAGTA